MNRLVELRKSNGLSQRQVETLIGVSQQSLSHYENGRQEPPLGTWELLAKLYGVKPQYLVGWTDEPH